MGSLFLFIVLIRFTVRSPTCLFLTNDKRKL